MRLFFQTISFSVSFKSKTCKCGEKRRLFESADQAVWAGRETQQRLLKTVLRSCGSEACRAKAGAPPTANEDRDNVYFQVDGRGSSREGEEISEGLCARRTAQLFCTGSLTPDSGVLLDEGSLPSQPYARFAPPKSLALQVLVV